MDPIIQSMQDVFERQRKAFRSQPYLSLGERKDKLMQRRSSLPTTSLSAHWSTALRHIAEMMAERGVVVDHPIGPPLDVEDPLKLRDGAAGRH